MTSSSPFLRLDPALSDPQTTTTSPRISALHAGASWPAMATALSAIAEISGRVNGLGASCTQDTISMADAHDAGREVLTAIDDAMAAVVEVSGLESDSGSALFAESADLLTDVCVIGTWTLQRKRAELEGAMESGDAARSSDACDSARRAVIRALGAIERALLPPGVSGAVARLSECEADRARRTRGLYRSFRAAVRPDAAPTAATIEARLTAVGVALAQVLASPHYRELRASDRRIFREIEARLTAFWSTPRTVVAGVRLFQDIAGFAGCLRTINHRAELMEHDARTAAIALSTIGDDDDAVVDEGALEAMGPLLGADDELDDFLLGRRQARAGAVRPLLARMARHARG